MQECAKARKVCTRPSDDEISIALNELLGLESVSWELLCACARLQSVITMVVVFSLLQ